MKSKLLRLSAVAAGLVVAVAAVFPGGSVSAPVANAAQSDYFLKIEGVDGESKEKGHEGQIEIQSFSWGLSQTGSFGSGGGGGAGKVNVQDISFMASPSKASPKLFISTATGEHFKKAVLFGRKSGGSQQDYYVITLEDVIISSFKSAGDAAGVTESFSLNFAKITYEYKPSRADGSLDAAVKAGYDVKANKKI